MDFLIRQATENDYEGLNSLFEEIDEHHRKALPDVFRKPEGPARSRDFLAGVFADERAVIFVAEMDSRIIGLVHAYVLPLPRIWIRIPSLAVEVDTIVVTQKCRRNGVGKALMETAQQWAVRMNAERVELSVWDFNQEARHLYSGLGYDPAFIRMWKPL